MTEYEKLIALEDEFQEVCVTVKQKRTNKIAIAVSCRKTNEVALFWGNPNGSDDTEISVDEFNRDFIIVHCDFD